MNMNVFKKISNAFYLPFILGYDILQTQLNHYDIPCDVAFEYCLELYETYSGSMEAQQDKSEYECLQDYVDNHMHKIETSLIELAEKWCEYDENLSPISIEATAQSIYDRLQYCGFNDVTDSSGYFLIKQFEDEIDRAVDVYKSTEDKVPHYVIYCSYEDDSSDYKYTNDLSLEELTRVLKEISEEE